MMWRKDETQEVEQLKEAGQWLRTVRQNAVEVTGLHRKYDLLEYFAKESACARGIFHMDTTDQPAGYAILYKNLRLWLQDTMRTHRRMVLGDDIFEELRDGYVLTELLSVLRAQYGPKDERDLAEHTKPTSLAAGINNARLQEAVNRVDRVLSSTARREDQRSLAGTCWTVESIAAGEEVSILRLLIALVRHHRCPVDLPQDVKIKVMLIQSGERGGLRHEQRSIQLTDAQESAEDEATGNGQVEKDKFDVFFESSPEKAQALLASLMSYVQKTVSVHGVAFDDAAKNLSDGITLLHLASLIGGYFLNIGSYAVPKRSQNGVFALGLQEKTANVRLALSLLRDEGVSTARVSIDGVLHSESATLTRLILRIREKLQQRSLAVEP